MGTASVISGMRGERCCWLAGSALALPFFLSGCMLAGQPPDDMNVADAVPKAERRSPLGNPPWYTALGRRYTVLASADGYVARGVASWYGPDFHGKRASSGEVYNMYSMTAAHPTLPLPSYVRVTNLENGRAAIVRVNDRGPFVDDRLIDLSYAAARKLGIWRNGTAYVEVRAITPPQNGDDADRLMVAEAVPRASSRVTTAGPVVERLSPTGSLPAQSAVAGVGTTPLPDAVTYPAPVQAPPRAEPALAPAPTAWSASSMPAAETAEYAGSPAPAPPAVPDYRGNVATPSVTSDYTSPAPAPRSSASNNANTTTAAMPSASDYAGRAAAPQPLVSDFAGYTGSPAVAASASLPPASDYADSPAMPMAPLAGTQIYVQVGAFSMHGNADSVRERLTPLRLGTVQIVPSDVDSLYRVRVGPLADAGEAQRVIAILNDHGYSTHRMIQEPANTTLGGAQKLNVQAF